MAQEELELEQNQESPSALASAAPDAWYRDLPSDLHSNETLRKHSTMESFAKEALNAQSLIGRKGIIPPTEESTIEDWDRYYAQLGRPEGLDKYSADEWEVPETKGFPRDSDFEDQLLKQLYDNGLSEKQAKNVWEFYISSSSEAFQGQMAKHNELGEELESRLASTYGEDREVKMNGARRAWSELGARIGASTDEWLGFLEQPMANGQRLGDQWPLIQAFVSLGESSSESTLKGGKHEGFQESSATTPAAAREELARIMGDPGFINSWADKKHAGHKAAIDQVNQLHEIIYGD